MASVDGGKDYRGNCFTFTGQKVWARQIDPERASPQILNDHSTLWVLGSKTESAGVSYETRNAGKTEALGGYVYNWSPVIDDKLPIIINHESQATHVMTTSGKSDEGHYYKVMARETKNGVTKELLWKDVPRRFENQSVIPLYIGYK